MLIRVDQPAPGVRRSDDGAHAAFPAQGQHTSQRQRVQQRVGTGDDEEIQIHGIGEAFDEVFLQPTFPACEVAHFPVAAGADGLNLLGGAHGLEGGRAALVGELGEDGVNLRRRLIAVIDVVDGQAVDVGDAEPLQ